MTTSQSEQPSEEELRAAYEAQMARIRVEHVLFDQVSMLVDLGMRRTGLVAGTEQERDLGQVKLAIDGVKAMIPLIEQFAGDQIPAIKQAVSQMQLAYVRAGGTATAASPEGPGGPSGTPTGPAAPPPPAASGSAPESEPEPEPIKPGEPGPAQRSGRLWVPDR